MHKLKFSVYIHKHFMAIVIYSNELSHDNVNKYVLYTNIPILPIDPSLCLYDGIFLHASLEGFYYRCPFNFIRNSVIVVFTSISYVALSNIQIRAW